MSINKRYIALIVAGLMMTTVSAFGAYVVGDTVADFTLPDAYGNQVSFSDYNGMVILINFWTST